MAGAWVVSRTSREVVSTYLRALSEADVDSVLELFADGAMVHSPLYGPLPASEFYPALFADTREANLTLESVMHGSNQDGLTTLSFWFHFDWRLPSGVAAPFDVVDVATVNAEGKFSALHIIYDTVDVRSAYEAEVGRPSWRANDS